MKKLTFTADQLVSSTTASKKFGELRRKAKVLPQFITENGVVDTVMIGYPYFEQMVEKLTQLEQLEEERILNERIDRITQDPASTMNWNEIRKEPHEGAIGYSF